MQRDAYICQKVHCYYWDEDVNCATTMLKILSEIYQIQLDNQVINAAIGMHGAGGYGAQCGLVEGSLMFIGILGRTRGVLPGEITGVCYSFAEEFEQEFVSLLCTRLRPQGFNPDNPPHLCEKLTQNAVRFTANYLDEKLNE